MSNPYLAAAYAFVWLTFIFYEWSLARRKVRLSRELEDLKKQAQDSPRSGPPSE
ncbi:MAG TPA: CcmD family protein [Terriglobia bacterium]|nr:CcmD family protein [Terriglobia bacterium]